MLKALHHDPLCSPFMADWFEERGDEQLATWLRLNGAMVPSGQLLIESLWKLPARSRDTIRFAVVREATDRLERYMRGSFSEIARHCVQRNVAEHIEMRTGDRNRDRRVIEEDGFSAGVGRSDFTYLELRKPNDLLYSIEYCLRGPYDPINWEPLPLAVQMYYGTCGWQFGENMLNGHPLQIYADVWCGTAGHEVIVSRFRDSHIRFWLP